MLEPFRDDFAVPIQPEPLPALDLNYIRVQDSYENETRISGYINGITQAVFDQWERTYFSNAGILISPVTLSVNIEDLNTFFIANQSIVTGDIAVAYQNMLTLLEWFPAEHVKQTHNFEVLMHPQEMGVRLQRHELIRNVDFANISINGGTYVRGFPINSNEEIQRLPKLITLELIDISEV